MTTSRVLLPAIILEDNVVEQVVLGELFTIH
jgi:hypothetical protein